VFIHPMHLLPLLLLGIYCSLGVSTLTAASDSTAKPAVAKPAPPPLRPPTLANVAYGTHERQILDLYQAKSSQPTPLLFFIHGGGWVRGKKEDVQELEACLAAGISVVSINYRFIQQAQLAGVMPPVQWPLEDAARALQFVRSKAGDWNINKTRIAASGGSAGACSSLFLAFHPDLADPKSSDPISRESTRLWCAAVNGAQTSLDPKQLKEWTPNSRYGGHAFGFMDPNDLKTRDTRFAEFYDQRESVLQWIEKFSPYGLVSQGDCPVYLKYNDQPALGQPQRDPTHTVNYGVKLQERCRAFGVECELSHPGAAEVKHQSIAAFLISKLKE
jgi:acetyl esterase/lipase